jgi:Protein kinase domain/PEGA domain
LAEVLRISGPMDLSTCLRIVEQVASALDHAHRQDVVHGNLKPTNVFIDDEKWVRVGDFAVLDAFGRPTSPKQGAPVLHRPEYMAPEQFYARTVGASADQYAFAVLVYQCLSGTLPFVGDSFEEVARLHANEPPPRLSHLRPDLPLHVLEAIQRALSKVPGGRFATVLDFASALATGPSTRASASRLTSTARASVGATPVLVVQPDRRQRIRRLAIGATLVGLFGAVAALAIAKPPFVQKMLEASGRTVGALTGSERSEAYRPSLQWETLDRPPTPSPIDPVVMDSVAGGDPVIAVPQPRPRREIVPPTPAQLFVNASPWGTVYIDGKSIGNTPKANVEIMPGNHTIRVARDGFEPFEREVTVKAGQVIRLLDIVLKPRLQ